MTDISKCNGKDCGRKDECWRFKAPSGYWQSYIDPEVRGDDCKHFWQVEREREKYKTTLTESDSGGICPKTKGPKRK